MSKTRRVKAFGQKTPEDFVNEMCVSMRRFCKCGAPAPCEVKIYLPLSETPVDQCAAIASRHDGDKVPVIFLDTTTGKSTPPNGGGEKYVLSGQIYTCRKHLPYAEKIAAKAPSYAYVHVDRGPDVGQVAISV